MKTVVGVCLVAWGLVGAAGAQEASKPVLRPGISVAMPVVSQAVEMRAADKEDATVVVLTAEGGLFVGTKPVETGALKWLNAGTVYLKADARVPLQKVLTVVDALRGRPVVLLTAPTVPVKQGRMAPPYGVKLNIAGQ